MYYPTPPSPLQDAQRRNQHGHAIPEWNAPAMGGTAFMSWAAVQKGLAMGKGPPHDFHHDVWDQHKHHHHTVWGDNCTHSTDVISREGARMVMEHDALDVSRPLFLFLPYQVGGFRC